MIPIRFLLLLLALLSGARASTPVPALPPKPGVALCRVIAHVKPAVVGRRLEFSLRPDCPPGSVAYVQLSSKLGGSQPEPPTGFYTLRPGQTLTYTLLSWWWLDWRDRSGRLWRVPETPRR